MSKTRLEAFSDAVIAIIMTVMVLELHVPHGSDWQAVKPMVPPLLTYVLSFVILGIYWNNHHHLFHATQKITGRVLWANLHLLFWLSLIPFVTGWMGENHFDSLPTAVYGAVLLMCAVSYELLQRTIIAGEGEASRLAHAVGDDLKGKISLALYIAAIPLAFVHELISDAIYVTVALIWFIPDRRIETAH
jgi:uncharacterized membrane protein